MNVKLLTEDNLELLSLKGGCICSSESTLIKMPHCWQSHVAAHLDLSANVRNQATDAMMSLYDFDANKLAAFKKPPIGKVWQIGCFYDTIPLLLLLL